MYKYITIHAGLDGINFKIMVKITHVQTVWGLMCMCWQEGALEELV